MGFRLKLANSTRSTRSLCQIELRPVAALQDQGSQDLGTYWYFKRMLTCHQLSHERSGWRNALESPSGIVYARC